MTICRNFHFQKENNNHTIAHSEGSVLADSQMWTNLGRHH